MDQKVIEKGIADLSSEFKSHIGRVGQQFGEVKDQLGKMQTQLDAVDVRGQHIIVGDPGGSSLERVLQENDSVAQLLRDRKGRAVMRIEGKAVAGILERKTTLLSSGVGYTTPGVMGSERIPGIVAEARQELRIRNVLTANPTTQPMVDFVKVTSPMAFASPQTEGNDKAQNAVTFAPASERVRTLATWIPASRQILDDMQELRNFLDNSLGYYVNLAEELQLLGGDNTGENLHGLVPQAAAFNTTLLSASAGWNKIDIIGRSAQQIEMAKELEPSFVVVNPKDYWDMRLTKNTQGNYVLGDPQGPVNTAALFGLQPVRSTSIAAGTFLVGSGAGEAAEIRDRMELVVEISTEHSDYFTKNLVAIRAEKRLALVVKRPSSFVTGSFTTSPA